ncbi:MAG: histidine triad nucleotide-binding protein [Candidatus Marinimicrobia bacterium]|nr:histidine triad nucleotide-binding protein [Candidatus Neomarinimicrobiota bacterium]
MTDDCLFCNIISGQMDTDFVYEDESIVAFKDINPMAPVHILIVPKKHIPTVNDILEQDTELVGRMVQVAQKMASQQDIDEDGYRLVFNCGEMGGQEINHLHLHLLGGRKMEWPAG